MDFYNSKELWQRGGSMGKSAMQACAPEFCAQDPNQKPVWPHATIIECLQVEDRRVTGAVLAIQSTKELQAPGSVREPSQGNEAENVRGLHMVGMGV